MKKAILIFFCLLNGFLSGREEISFIDRIAILDNLKSDSAALVAAEKMKEGSLTYTQLMHVNLRIVRLSARLQKFQKAIALANECAGKLHGTGSDSLEAAFDLQLGAAYYYMEQRARAIDYFEKGAELANKSGAWLLENKFYNNLGGAFTDLKQYKKAEEFLLKGIDIMNAHGLENDYGTLLSYRVLGALYAGTQQNSRAKAIYISLLGKPVVKKDTNLLADVLLYYSEALFKEGKIDSALIVSEKVVTLSRPKKMFHELIAVLTSRSRILSAAGRYREAYELMREAYSLSMLSFTKDLDKRISEVEVKYKTAQIIKEKEQAEENARQQQWIYLLSFTGILILTVAVAYSLNQKRVIKQKAVAHRQRLEALIEGEEKERGRIARDLHDGIVQDLTAIKLRLNTGHNNDEQLKAVIADIDRSAKEVRDIAYQMMPVALREYGLVAALEHLLQKSLVPDNIRFEFEAVNIDERLPEKIEICLYRLTQELVNNVIKHSGASLISLVVSKYQDAITLVMEDNGAGFNENEIKKGIGMNSLASRLEMVDGSLKFEAVEGSGTMAIIKIPLIA